MAGTANRAAPLASIVPSVITSRPSVCPLAFSATASHVDLLTASVSGAASRDTSGSLVPASALAICGTFFSTPLLA